MTSSLHGINSKHLKTGDPEPAAPAAGHVRLYTMRFCPWAERVAVYLAAKNIPTEIININLQQKPEWYFKKHPRGQVPTLELDGKCVIESGLIPEYLDDVFPETRILPKDPYAKYQQRLLVDRLSAIAPAFYGLIAALKDPSVKDEKIENAKKAVTEAEKLLAELETPFFGGEQPGYADYLSIPLFERMWLFSLRGSGPFVVEGFPGAEFPRLSRWFATTIALPATQAATQPPEIYDKFHKSYLAGAPEYDVEA